MLAQVITRHRQKNIEFRRIGKTRSASLQYSRGITKSADAAIGIAQTHKRRAQLLTLKTAGNRVLVKPDGLIPHALQAEGTRQLIVDLGVIRICVIQIEQNGQRFRMLRSVAQLDGTMEGFVHVGTKYSG